MKIRVLSVLLCLLFALVALPASAEYQAKAPAPSSIKLSTSARTILPGGFFKLSATIKPAKASKKVSWTSSDPGIATVNASGLIEAKALGNCTITATTANGALNDSCAVTVDYAYGAAKVRFFGIANSNYRYINPLDSPANDLILMDEVYGQARFQGGTVKRYNKHDLTGSGIRSTLKKMATGYGIKATDVTFFYYSGHGAADAAGSPYNGALCGVDAGKRSVGAKAYVTVNEVQKYLDKVPGTVIVILDSCLSGQFIERKGTAQNASPTTADTQAFTDAWVTSLSQSKATNYVVNKALTRSAKSYKYKILAACAPMESSFLDGFTIDNSDNVYAFSFLTLAFCDAAVPYLSSAGYAMDGDTNKDLALSLSEAYAYARPSVYQMMQQLNQKRGWNESQTVTAWPANDPFPLSSYT